MLQEDKDVIIFIIAGTALLLLLGLFIISFLFFYQKKQSSYIKEKVQLKNNFRQELLKTQLEVHEQTLNHVSQEIHDNIGQVLSFIKLNLGAIKNLPESEKQERIAESRELVSHVINDLRDLSKSLSYESIADNGLAENIRTELDRINKTGNFSIEFNLTGQSFPLGQQRELVVFRIFQECLQNIIKHSKANHLKITLQYSTELFNLIIQDDGIGFCPDEMKEQGGSGLKNMKSRAKLIGATISITSSSGKGCITNVSLNPSQTQVSFDGLYPSGPD